MTWNQQKLPALRDMRKTAYHRPVKVQSILLPKRNCLRCREEFQPQHKGNFLCCTVQDFL